MDKQNGDHIPMLSNAYVLRYDEPPDIEDPRYTTWNPSRVASRSFSMSVPRNSLPNEHGNMPISHTAPLREAKKSAVVPLSGSMKCKDKSEQLHHARHFVKTAAIVDEELPPDNLMGEEMLEDSSIAKNGHLLRSGPLGKCSDPYCITCPYYSQPAEWKLSRASGAFDKFHSALYGDAKGSARRILSLLHLPVMNPHAKAIQQWNKFFVISCLVAIFVDPLFFFPLTVQKENMCLVLDWTLAKALAAVRSITDVIYLMHMCFQIMILSVLPEYMGASSANYAKNLLRASVLLQYLPRIYRFLPLLSGQSPTGFIFETAWANFVINLLTFILAGHVVGSCWYLFGLQRVNQCLRNACSKWGNCQFIDCGHDRSIERANMSSIWRQWLKNSDAVACFNVDNGPFNYGIYEQVANLSTKNNFLTRYVYSLFWGFQQISTLAGNLVPSDFLWEVLFTMGIVGLGLLLFALLIGNMQNFLQALGRRRLDMQLRRRDVEQWMSHRRLPEELRRQVRQSERFTWAATRGVDEELLLENLPEDLQRDIRRHLFKFVKKVHIFTLMNEPMLDAIRERLKPKLYIEGSRVLYRGGYIDKMIFVVRGKLESIGSDGNVFPLSEGDICGEELLTWCLEHSSIGGKKVLSPGQRLVSVRDVQCVSNVEAFVLRDTDLEEVTFLFARFLRSPRFQGAIRYESPYWRELAATCIQVAWRYRQKRLNRAARPPLFTSSS